jgi:hypothetical protein
MVAWMGCHIPHSLRTQIIFLYKWRKVISFCAWVQMVSWDEHFKDSYVQHRFHWSMEFNVHMNHTSLASITDIARYSGIVK